VKYRVFAVSVFIHAFILSGVAAFVGQPDHEEVSTAPLYILNELEFHERDLYTPLKVSAGSTKYSSVRVAPSATAENLQIDQEKYQVVLPETLLLNRPAPDYPDRARKHGWEGNVTLTYRANEDGRVIFAQVIHSSGYPTLDHHALQAVKEWRERPGSHQVTIQYLLR
jgi:TonB family protein